MRQRLQNLSVARGEEFQFLLSEYAIKRLLYRLSHSEHQQRFILKGAKLFTLWSAHPHRATWDLDLGGKDAESVASMESTFKKICAATVQDDGLEFDLASIRGEEI